MLPLKDKQKKNVLLSKYGIVHEQKLKSNVLFSMMELKTWCWTQTRKTKAIFELITTLLSLPLSGTNDTSFLRFGLFFCWWYCGINSMKCYPTVGILNIVGSSAILTLLW